MTEEQEVRKAQVTIHLDPFDDPNADDVYVNLTGVANTQHEVILMFARVLPPTTAPKGGKLAIAPTLRVTMPPGTARHLLEQLQQQFSLRDRLEGRDVHGESEDAGS